MNLGRLLTDTIPYQRPGGNSPITYSAAGESSSSPNTSLGVICYLLQAAVPSHAAKFQLNFNHFDGGRGRVSAP